MIAIAPDVDPAGVLLMILLRAVALLCCFWAAFALFHRHPRARVLLCRVVVVSLMALPVLGFIPALAIVRIPVSPDIAPLGAAADITGNGAPFPTDANGNALLPDNSRVPYSMRSEGGTAAGTTDADAGRADLDSRARNVEAPRGWTLLQVIAAVWLGGTALLMARWVAALVMMRRWAAHAVPAPDWVCTLSWKLCLRLGIPRAVRLGILPRASTPMLLGFPAHIILPAHLVKESRMDDLTAALAHEHVHVRRRDWIWSQYMTLATAAYWPVPLTWMLRRSHDAASELVCDHIAASMVGEKQAYAGSLARQSLHALANQNNPRLGHLASMPMLRSPGIRQRIDLLLSNYVPPLLTVRMAVATVGITLLVAALLGGAILVKAERGESATKSSPDSIDTSDLRVARPVASITFAVKDKDGVPVEGAEAYFAERVQTLSSRPDRLLTVIRPEEPLRTGPDGHVTFDCYGPHNESMLKEFRTIAQAYFRVPGKAAGTIYLPVDYVPGGTPIEVRLMPAASFRAKVELPAGQAAAMNKVTVSLRRWVMPAGQEPAPSFGEMTLAGVSERWPQLLKFTPNEQGEVTIPDVPTGAMVGLMATAPGMAATQAFNIREGGGLLPGILTLKLKPEGVLTGTVRDKKSGKGVPWIQVRCSVTTPTENGDLSTFRASTDAEGRYRMDGMPEAMYEVQIQPPPGLVYMPASNKKVVPGQETAGVDLMLETGTVVTGQIRDKATGKGLSGGFMLFVNGAPDAGSANSYASAKTDETGTFRVALPSGKSRHYLGSFQAFADNYIYDDDLGSGDIEIKDGTLPPPLLVELTPKPDGMVKKSPETSKPATASGRVVDEQGKPVSAVPVGMSHEADKGLSGSGMSLVYPRAAVTAEDGTYSFQVQPFGKCSVWAGGENADTAEARYEISRLEPFETKEGARHQLPDLVLRRKKKEQSLWDFRHWPTAAAPENPKAADAKDASPGSTEGKLGSVTFVAKDMSGAVVPGADVYLLQYINGPETMGGVDTRKRVPHGPLKTDASGRVTIPDLALDDKGTWIGAVYIRLQGKLAGGKVTGGHMKQEHVIELKPTMSFKGKVTAPLGVDMTKVQVSLLLWMLGRWESNFFGCQRIPGQPEPWPELVHFTPDATGNVTIPDLPIGGAVYIAANGPLMGEAQSCSFQLTPKTEDFRLNLNTEGLITGTVRDKNGKEVPGVMVSCRATRMQGLFVTHAYSALTDKAGRYRISGLPVATYEVTLTRPAGSVYRPVQGAVVPSGGFATADFVLEPGTLVTGKIIDNKSGKESPQNNLHN